MDIMIETEGEPLPLIIEERVAITFPDGVRHVLAVWKKEDIFDATAHNRVLHRIFLKRTP